MNYDILYGFVLATAALAISPGPDNIYVLTLSVAHGKKYGMATVSGLMTGCLVHTTLLAFGLSAIIKDNERLFFGIKVFGALYLFYLAYQVLRSDAKLQLTDGGKEKKSLGALFKQGFIMNVLNPKVTIFFLAFFPGFLFSNTLDSVLQFYVLGGLFILVSFIIFSLVAILAGAISNQLKKHSRVGLLLKWLQIAVFVGIGFYLLLSD
mgnify:CR=1 FL=1